MDLLKSQEILGLQVIGAELDAMGDNSTMNQSAAVN